MTIENQPLVIDKIEELAYASFLPIVEVELELSGLPKKIPLASVSKKTELISLKKLVDEWRIKPRLKQGKETALTLDSFIDLTNRHKTAESVIFANTDWQKPSLTAVIDYHPRESGDEPADNCGFTIGYEYPLSEEWKAWVQQNGKSMGQGDFAAFIEDHIFDLAAPQETAELEKVFNTRFASPAELMQLSRGLQINVDSIVRQVTNLQTGEAQIAFEETHKDNTGKPIQVPGMFLLKIAPFFMGAAIEIPVRLRYRVNGGKITWAYQIYRPDIHVTDHVRNTLTTVEGRVELPVYEALR